MIKIEAERLRDGPQTIQLKQTPAEFDLVDDPEFRFEDPVTGTLVASYVAGSVLLKGTIRTVALAPCVRCLEPLRVSLVAEVTFIYMADPRLQDPAKHPDLADDNSFYFDGDILDPTEQLREALLLELPGHPACELEEDRTCPIRGVKVPKIVIGPVEGEGEVESEGKPQAGTWSSQLKEIARKMKSPEDPKGPTAGG